MRVTAELRCSPPNTSTTPSSSEPMFADPLTAKLADFVRGVGIEVRTATLDAPTFLPGITIRHGALLIDPPRLTYPGDVLHEAGHIAVSDPAERQQSTLSPNDGDEFAAIAWSYASIRHLDIDPAISSILPVTAAGRRPISRISPPAAMSACRCCNGTA